MPLARQILPLTLLLGLAACDDAAVPVDTTPPEAKAQEAIQAGKAKLQGYAKEGDKVRIPVDRAMELVAKEGIKPVEVKAKPTVSADAVATAEAALEAARAQPVEPFTPDPAKVAKGQEFFTTKTCSACHKVDGTRLVGPALNGFYGSVRLTEALEVVRGDQTYFTESLKAPTAKVTRGFPPAMPPLPVADEEIDALFHYLASLK